MIYRKFRKMRSFGDKVTWLVTLTSGVAIVGVCFALVAFDYASQSRETLASLQAQTIIVAMNSGAPLAFADRRNAAEALAAFEARPAVALATLFDINGGTFATYRRQGDVVPMSGQVPPEGRLMKRWLRHVIAVEDQGQLLGRIEVIYDLRELQNHLWRSLALSSLVSLVAVLLVYAFSLRINQILIKPIALLSQTATQVSQTKDYSLRARKVSDDEFGSFTDTFNQMLVQIQKQDVEIQASRAEALDASRLKDEFLATLSHELRTPMTPILGWAQILQRGTRDSDQVKQAAEVIERNARAQNRIVDDLLDMSRIVAGKVRLEIQPIDLADIIAESINTVAAAAEARGLRLERELQPRGGLTRGDPHRLQQVLWNLLSNAIKFTPPGGLVRVTLQRLHENIEIAVSDTGQGIAPEFLPHVFERFRQADSSNTRQHSGLGLGLAIVKQLVELHGGTIRVESGGSGEGAVFTVSLPHLSDPSEPAGEPGRPARVLLLNASTAAPASLDGLKLLLVDDERDARELVEHQLRSHGAEVVSAASAADAMKALLTFLPDALISDVGMPEKNGYDLLRQIRQLPATRGGKVPAIALTAFARPEDRHRALDAGFQAHLSKPVEQGELVATVAALVAAAR